MPLQKGYTSTLGNNKKLKNNKKSLQLPFPEYRNFVKGTLILKKVLYISVI